MFMLEGRPMVIENGVSRDMLKAGMIELISTAAEPKDEVFTITAHGLAEIRRLIGVNKLVELGLADEEA